MRRNHSPTVKANVALAALRGYRTLPELSEHFGGLPNLILLWKNRLESQATRIIEKGNGAAKDPWL